MATRITSNSMVRTYLGNMRTNLGGLNRSNEKLSTQRSFNRASENINDAARALRVRKLLSDNERYNDSASSLAKKLDTADSALRAMSGLYNDITHLVMQGSNDTMSQLDRDVIANQIDKLRDEALSIANTKYGNEYIFSAAGNADNSVPFKVNADGKLCFNGNDTPVDELVKDPMTGKVSVFANGNYNEIHFNGTNYIDVGLGLTSTGNQGVVRFDEKSVLRSSYSGVEMFGYGTDKNGRPVNFYGLFTEISTHIREGNNAEMITDLESLSLSTDHMLMSLSEIGGDSNFLSDITDQLLEDEVSLKEMQNDIESIDIAEEIMYNAQYEMAWTVTLQIGSSLLPQSIFDFLR